MSAFRFLRRQEGSTKGVISFLPVLRGYLDRRCWKTGVRFSLCLVEEGMALDMTIALDARSRVVDHIMPLSASRAVPTVEDNKTLT